MYIYKKNKRTLHSIKCRQTSLTLTTSTLKALEVQLKTSLRTKTLLCSWSQQPSCHLAVLCEYRALFVCWHLTFTTQPWRVLMRQCVYWSVGPWRASWPLDSYQPVKQGEYRAHAAWQWYFPPNQTCSSPGRRGGRQLFYSGVTSVIRSQWHSHAGFRLRGAAEWSEVMFVNSK